MADALHWHVRSCPCTHYQPRRMPGKASRGRQTHHTLALLGNSKGRPGKNHDSSSSGSSSSGGGNKEEPPVVIPEVLPPPARGSQYQSRDNSFSYGSGSGDGGGRGGVFSAFSSGDMWKGGGAGRTLLVRLQLMLFSFAWACCVYLIISSAAKLLVRLDRWLGITAGLGYGYSTARVHAAADADQDEESSTEDLIEVAGIVNHSAATTTVSGSTAAVGGRSTVDAGAISSLPSVDVAAGDTGQSAAQAKEAAPLNPSMHAHLQALKRYEQRDARGVDIGAHATAAYFMILSTLAFFFVMNQ